MKKFFWLIALLVCGPLAEAQNSIGAGVGYLWTHTSVAEYERVGRNDFLLDSMNLQKNVSSLTAAVTVDLSLGRHFWLITGFNYSEKGLNRVTFTDSTGYPWTTPAKQSYLGLSALLGYELPFHKSRFTLRLATGFQADFAVGQPNGGALFSGPYSRFFMPFSRFNEVDFSWRTELSGGYRLGPGKVFLTASFLYGMNDVLEDAFIIGRSLSAGVSAGYSLSLSEMIKSK